MPRVVAKPTSADLQHARRTVQLHLWPTTLLPVSPNRYLKLESHQPTGSFKVRGALTALSRVPVGTHVVTASAGNHALGMAWAARQLGVSATIIVAETASPLKIARLRRLGADLILHGRSYDEAEAYALSLQNDETIFISPYNDTAVIAGQSTIVDEITERLPDGSELNLFVPLGGGGLLAGIASRAAELSRSFRIVGVEPEASQAASAAVAAGKVTPVPIHETLADGLAGNLEPGAVTVDIIRDCHVALTTVSEDEIRQAIRALFEEHGVIAEGAAAVAYAAMSRLDFSGTGVAIVTGRNVETQQLFSILQG